MALAPPPRPFVPLRVFPRALALLPSDDAWRTALARSIFKTAQPHAAHPLSMRHTVPGLGTMLRLGLRDDIHPSERWPRGQAVASYARRGTGRQESAGQRGEPSGTQSGTAPLPGAFSAAAPLCWRHPPQVQQRRARWEQPPATGQALSLLAHHRGWAV